MPLASAFATGPRGVPESAAVKLALAVALAVFLMMAVFVLGAILTTLMTGTLFDRFALRVPDAEAVSAR